MPIYEYQCSSCGHQLEALQKFSDDALTNCPACQKETLTKLISSTSFQLKGTGWYVTDIRDKGKPKPAEASSSGKAEGSSSPSAEATSKDIKSGGSNSGSSTAESS